MEEIYNYLDFFVGNFSSFIHYTHTHTYSPYHIFGIFRLFQWRFSWCNCTSVYLKLFEVCLSTISACTHIIFQYLELFIFRYFCYPAFYLLYTYVLFYNKKRKIFEKCILSSRFKIYNRTLINQGHGHLESINN